MTDLDILDLDIKKLAVVRCLIQIINNDKMRSMYFERDLYDIINRYSADINRTFDEIKNKLQPAGLNTGGGVFGATGTGGSGSSAEASDSSDSGPFQYHSMNIPQVPIDNNNNNNDLNLDPLNLAGNSNNQPSDTDVQADTDNGIPAVNHMAAGNAPGVDAAAQIIGTDWLKIIADGTQKLGKKSRDLIKVYVGKNPVFDRADARDLIDSCSLTEENDLVRLKVHAENATLKDHAGKDKRLIKQKLRRIRKFRKWIDGTRYSRGIGSHHKLGDSFDIDKLIDVAVDSGVVIFQEDRPGTEFDSKSPISMIRLRDLTVKLLGGAKYKNFDKIFKAQFIKKFPNGTHTLEEGYDFVKGVTMLFKNRYFHHRINLGTLPRVSSSSENRLVILGEFCVSALSRISLSRGHFLDHVISLEYRDSLTKKFDDYKQIVQKLQNTPQTVGAVCALANDKQIPIVFTIYGDNKIYKNSVPVWIEIHSSPMSSDDDVKYARYLSSTLYNLDDSIANSSPINNDSADLATDNIFDASGSGQVPLGNSDNSLNSSAMPLNQQEIISNLDKSMQTLKDLFGDN